MSDATAIIIQLAVCLGFLFLMYRCCFRAPRAGVPPDVHPESNLTAEQQEDLRRLRERISERGNPFDPALRARENEARKELIEKNVFSRQIHREESVRELSNLLAIARGGVVDAVDEELGECSPAAASDDSNGLSANATGPHPTPSSAEEPAASTAESSLPPPSAPPAQAQGTTDTIATAIASQPETATKNDAPAPGRNPITLEPILNMWSNLAQTIGSEREGTKPNSQPATTGHRHKLECSICLEEYSPNDTIAWAKDGGDPPAAASSTVAAIRNDAGCDHIFHKMCLVAWLQDHDECPLCRRKVVHADADIRFAGW